MKTTTTIERTSKGVKLSLLGGWVLLVLSLWMMFSNGPLALIGGFAFFLAILLLVGAKAARWWLNG